MASNKVMTILDVVNKAKKLNSIDGKAAYRELTTGAHGEAPIWKVEGFSPRNDKEIYEVVRAPNRANAVRQVQRRYVHYDPKAVIYDLNTAQIPFDEHGYPGSQLDDIAFYLDKAGVPFRQQQSGAIEAYPTKQDNAEWDYWEENIPTVFIRNQKGVPNVGCYNVEDCMDGPVEDPYAVADWLRTYRLRGK